MDHAEDRLVLEKPVILAPLGDGDLLQGIVIPILQLQGGQVEADHGNLLVLHDFLQPLVHLPGVKVHVPLVADVGAVEVARHFDARAQPLVEVQKVPVAVQRDAVVSHVQGVALQHLPGDDLLQGRFGIGNPGVLPGQERLVPRGPMPEDLFAANRQGPSPDTVALLDEQGLQAFLCGQGSDGQPPDSGSDDDHIICFFHVSVLFTCPAWPGFPGRRSWRRRPPCSFRRPDPCSSRRRNTIPALRADKREADSGPSFRAIGSDRRCRW